MKKTLSLIITLSLLLSQMAFAATYSENPIIQTELKMRQFQEGLTSQDENPDQWSSRWRTFPTALNLDINGGFTAFSENNGFVGGLDLLTGEVAIDESLQLGSIGSDLNFELPITSEQTFSIDEVEALGIPSHQWKDMLEGKKYEVPKITKLVPRDSFFAYTTNPIKYAELEDVMEDALKTLNFDLYTLGNIGEMRERAFEKLKIPYAQFPIDEIEEVAFISEDLSLVPSTDFALIFKFKKDSSEIIFDFFKDKELISKEIGDYRVIATSEWLLNKINAVYENEGNVSLYEAADFHFALASLEERRDGIIYLSEAFIRKLTSPAYRINSRRRNTTLGALENLQYVSFAYRKITGEWPASFKQIAEEGYIQKNSIFEEDKYSIGTDGIVTHKEWGSLWNVTPINRVSINEITPAEKELYENFNEGYQSYFREFFDPVGVSFTISDQILFHTIILPLIDESSYNFMNNVFGEHQASEIDSAMAPLRVGAINLAAQFSVDKLLLESADSIKEAEDAVANEIGLKLKQGERLFDFVGDEIFFGVGGDNSFSLNNIADLDIWFGIKLNNQEKAELFMKKIFTAIGNDLGGTQNMGLLSVSTTEPISNSYNGVEYYLIPTGFVNVYYAFIDDTFYTTISQVAMNRLIEASTKFKKEQLGELERSFAFIQNNHHLVATIDFSKIAGWSSKELEGELFESKWQINDAFDQRVAYLSEVTTLAKILPGYDGSINNVGAYYRHIPVDYMGAAFTFDDGEVYFSKKGDDDYVPLTEIDDVSEIVHPINSISEIKEKLGEFKTGALGMNFTDNGLEVKISFGNPLQNEKDERFEFINNRGANLNIGIKGWQALAIGATILIVSTFLIISIINRRRFNKRNGDDGQGSDIPISS